MLRKQWVTAAIDEYTDLFLRHQYSTLTIELDTFSLWVPRGGVYSTYGELQCQVNVTGKLWEQRSCDSHRLTTRRMYSACTVVQR